MEISYRQKDCRNKLEKTQLIKYTRKTRAVVIKNEAKEKQYSNGNREKQNTDRRSIYAP